VSGPGAPRPLASDADRERLVALLREHYAVGLFGLDELDRRVGVVLSAQYLDEAAAAWPAAGWIPTNERFRDPSTSTVMRVWVDPSDQSRHYVPEPEP